MTKWITVKEAAEISSYHVVYIRKLARAGEIETQKYATVWQVAWGRLKVSLYSSNA